MVRVLIPAGGRGTRSRPLSDLRGKPWVYVAGEREIYYPIASGINAGFDPVIIAQQYGVKMFEKTIRDFGDFIEKNGLEYIEPRNVMQNKMNPTFHGTGDAISIPWIYKYREIGEKQFLHMSGDNLYGLNIEELKKAHKKTLKKGGKITVATLKLVDSSPGRLKEFGQYKYGKNGKIDQIFEKPKKIQSEHVGISLYLIEDNTQIIEDYLRTIAPIIDKADKETELTKNERDKLNFTSGFLAQAALGGHVYGVQFDESKGAEWDDWGYPYAVYNSSMKIKGKIADNNLGFIPGPRDMVYDSLTNTLMHQHDYKLWKQSPPNGTFKNCIFGKGTVIEGGSYITNTITGPNVRISYSDVHNAYLDSLVSASGVVIGEERVIMGNASENDIVVAGRHAQLVSSARTKDQRPVIKPGVSIPAEFDPSYYSGKFLEPGQIIENNINIDFSGSVQF